MLIGSRPLHSIAPETDIREAALLMAKHRVGALAIIEGDSLIGVLSERDIVYRCVAGGKSIDDSLASDVMTRDPVTVGIDDEISDALAAKLGEAFRHLPVMDQDRVVGLLSYRDIPAEYAMMFERFREMSSARADEAL